MKEIIQFPKNFQVETPINEQMIKGDKFTRSQLSSHCQNLPNGQAAYLKAGDNQNIYHFTLDDIQSAIN